MIQGQDLPRGYLLLFPNVMQSSQYLLSIPVSQVYQFQSPLASSCDCGSLQSLHSFIPMEAKKTSDRFLAKNIQITQKIWWESVSWKMDPHMQSVYKLKPSFFSETVNSPRRIPAGVPWNGRTWPPRNRQGYGHHTNNTLWNLRMK